MTTENIRDIEFGVPLERATLQGDVGVRPVWFGITFVLVAAYIGVAHLYMFYLYAVLCLGCGVAGLFSIAIGFRPASALFLKMSISIVAALGIAYAAVGACLSLEGKTIGAADTGHVYARGDIIALHGPISEVVEKQWASAAATTPGGKPRLVRLNSEGGNMFVARRMARDVAAWGATVEVSRGYQCKSACVSIFAAGKVRLADPSAVFLFHATSFPLTIPFLPTVLIPTPGSSVRMRDDLSAFPSLLESLDTAHAFDTLAGVTLRGADLPEIDDEFAQVGNTQ